MTLGTPPWRVATTTSTTLQPASSPASGSISCSNLDGAGINLNKAAVINGSKPLMTPLGRPQTFSAANSCKQAILANSNDREHLEPPPGKWQRCGDLPSAARTTTVPPPPVIIQDQYSGTASSSTATADNAQSYYTAPWRKSEGGTGLPAAQPRFDSFQRPWNKLNTKCGLYPQGPP